MKDFKKNFVFRRTACLVEKLDCENGLDLNVKQFCESVAQKVNQKNKWQVPQFDFHERNINNSYFRG